MMTSCVTLNDARLCASVLIVCIFFNSCSMYVFEILHIDKKDFILFKSVFIFCLLKEIFNFFIVYKFWEIDNNNMSTASCIYFL